jgi:hypothetical protein
VVDSAAVETPVKFVGVSKRFCPHSLRVFAVLSGQRFGHGNAMSTFVPSDRFLRADKVSGIRMTGRWK